MFDPIEHGRGEVSGWMQDTYKDEGASAVVIKCGLAMATMAFVMGIFYIGIAGITDRANAERVLLDSGFSEVATFRSTRFNCKESDLFVTGFKAKGPSGRKVSGVVCASLFSDSTIRVK